jgi:ribosomal protein S18 acetylase RimI-like enzyme
MNTVIRQIEVRDIQAVRHVIWETWLATYGSVIPERDIREYFDEHYSVPALTELFKKIDVMGYIVEVDDATAGFVRTEYRRNENRFFISSLYILPAYQGGGLGRKLLTIAEDKARQYGVKQVWLAVMTDNTTALAWYAKLGFNFIDEDPFTVGKTHITHRIGYRTIPPEKASPVDGKKE